MPRRATSATSAAGKAMAAGDGGGGHDAVAFSARLTASIRAAETQRVDPQTGAPAADRLVVDPFAAALAGDHRPHTHFVHRRYQAQRLITTAAAATATTADTTAPAPTATADTKAPAETASSPSPSASAVAAVEAAAAEAVRAERAARPFLLVRTRLFDDIVTRWATRHAPPPPPPPPTAAAAAVATAATAIAATPAPTAASPLPQIVLLGAGLDSRAYRLPALAHARVFEFDRPSVIAYKRAALDTPSAGDNAKADTAPANTLTAATATTTATSTATPPSASADAKTVAPDKQPAVAAVHAPVTTPAVVVAASLVRVAGDLVAACACRVCHRSRLDEPIAATTATAATTTSGSTAATVAAPACTCGAAVCWLQALREAGFRADAATLWVCEGVLMYLPPHTVAPLLRTIALATTAVELVAATAANTTAVLRRRRLAPSALVFDGVNADTIHSTHSYFRMFRWGLDRHDVPALLRATECGGWAGGHRVAGAVRAVESAMTAGAAAATSTAVSVHDRAMTSSAVATRSCVVTRIGRGAIDYGRYSADDQREQRLVDTGGGGGGGRGRGAGRPAQYREVVLETYVALAAHAMPDAGDTDDTAWDVTALVPPDASPAPNAAVVKTVAK